jgi:hypothetical protein
MSAAPRAALPGTTFSWAVPLAAAHAVNINAQTMIAARVFMVRDIPFFDALIA